MSYINAMITSGLAFAIPLFIMAVGGIYSEKSGITNLAVEGFQGFGAFCGAVVAVFLGMNTGLSSSSIIYVAMLFSFIGGAIYAIIHALLCIKFRADQVISGVVINILGVALTTFLTTTINTALFGNASNKFTLGHARRVPAFQCSGHFQDPGHRRDIYKYLPVRDHYSHHRGLCMVSHV